MAWCTCKFVVLSIKTFYFFAVLLPLPLSLVLLSSRNSAPMVMWRHTSPLYYLFVFLVSDTLIDIIHKIAWSIPLKSTLQCHDLSRYPVCSRQCKIEGIRSCSLRVQRAIRPRQTQEEPVTIPLEMYLGRALIRFSYSKDLDDCILASGSFVEIT